MEDYEFLSYSQLEELFTSKDVGPLKSRLIEVMLIGSVSDMLYITEQFKKGKIKVSFDELQSFYKEINDSGVYYPEVDRDSLLENMFESDRLTASLRIKPCNKKISPRFSISLIALFPNGYRGCSEELFNSVEEYYLNFESYE